MYNQSILVSIQHSVNQIKWKTTLQKDKALMLCKNIFNLYTIKGYQFRDYLSLSRNYFISLLPSKRDYAIKQILLDNRILECDNSYSVTKRIGKGYRFSEECLRQENISSTITAFTFSTVTGNSTISYLCPHSGDQAISSIKVDVVNEYKITNPATGATISYLCPHSNTQYLQAFYNKLLERLQFDSDTDDLINDLSIVHAADLTTNENIQDQYVYIHHNKDKYRYKRDNAITFAKETGNDLIKFKDKFYIDQPELFTKNKSNQLKISYCQSVFNIKNRLFYCGRNDTNNRLDYNLTGLKKELFTKLRFDGERLTELDIANAQFAIAAHLNPAIDEKFIHHAQTGTFYNYIEKQLGLKEGDGKPLMFRIAFDKVKSTKEFESVRAIFPKFMCWVDQYKNEHGYKMFSNLLQKKEAEIMIDGLLFHLISKGYEVFTIHDALRVKQSQANEIDCIVKDYFNGLGFKCKLRIREHTNILK